MNLVLAEKQGHLRNLDLDGLEFQYENDQSVWTPLNVQRDDQEQVVPNFFKTLAEKKLGNADKPRLRVRRKLQTNPQLSNTKWRVESLLSTLPHQWLL